MKKINSISSVILAISLTLSACDISITINPTAVPISTNPPLPAPSKAPKPTNTPISTSTKIPHPTSGVSYDVYAGSTGYAEVPFIALHKSGEVLALSQDLFATISTGIIWTSSSGESIVIYTNGSSDTIGLPKTVVYRDYVILYGNYTSTTVDITLIHPNGIREYYRTKYSADHSNRIANHLGPTYRQVSFTIPNSIQSQQVDYLDIFEDMLLGVDIVTCGLVAAAPIAIAAPELSLLALFSDACRGAFLGWYIYQGKLEGKDVGALELIQGIENRVGCARGSPKDCIALLVEKAQNDRELTEKQAEQAKHVAPTSPGPVPKPTKPKYP